MQIENFEESRERVMSLLRRKPQGSRGNLLHIVKQVQDKRKKILAFAAKHPTPFYLFDDKALAKSIRDFVGPFNNFLPGHKAFYAVKANYHPFVLEGVVRHGLGLDVSSGRELELGLKAGAKAILFSGPGKSAAELNLAFAHADKVILNIDNFDELKRVGALAAKQKHTLRAGVRFFSALHGTWSKFGIPLRELKGFWQAAAKYPQIKLQGIQFHSSLNILPERNVKILAELGKYLQANFSPAMRGQIKFIDIGGGYYPDRAEGFYPWSHHYPWTLSAGHFLKLANDAAGKPTKFKDKYYITTAAVPQEFARAIGKAYRKHLRPIVNCAYFTEPGRIICNSSTSIITRAMDIKNKVVITDAGINMTGWEFGQHFYFPIVNLTHPAVTEKEWLVYGSLCTPRDFWGYYVYAKKMASGDVLAIPNQGAYKFTLAQTFIKPIPPTLRLE